MLSRPRRDEAPPSWIGYECVADLNMDWKRISYRAALMSGLDEKKCLRFEVVGAPGYEGFVGAPGDAVSMI